MRERDYSRRKQKERRLGQGRQPCSLMFRAPLTVELHLRESLGWVVFVTALTSPSRQRHEDDTGYTLGKVKGRVAVTA